MRRVNYFLTVSQIEKLEAAAEASGLTVSEIIRRFIDKGLDREDKRSKRDLG